MSKFEGFDLPNTTPVPDVVFDKLLHELTGNELKALLYIIRRTYGFGKNADAISLSQFRKGITTKDEKVLDRGCGIEHNRTILVALNALETKGYITRKKRQSSLGDDDPTIYKLHFKEALQADVKTGVVTSSNDGVVTSSNDGWLPEVTTGGYSTSLGVVTSGNTQETVIQETVIQEREGTSAPITNLIEFKAERALSSLSSRSQPLSEEDIALCEAETEHRIKVVKPPAQKRAVSVPIAVAVASAPKDADRPADAARVHAPSSSPPARPGLRVTHAPTSTPPSQGKLNLKETGDLPRSEKELRQMESRIDGMRAEQIWAIVEDELHTSFLPSHRRRAANVRGMNLLLEDKITNERIRLALQAMDNYQILHFTLENFHGWIPLLLAPKKLASPKNQNQESETVKHKNFTGYAKELQAHIAAGGC